MQITIKYFGLLSEVTGCKEEVYEFSGGSIAKLIDELYVKHPSLRNKEFQVAQNQELVPLKTELISNEIVLLPPFSGG